jgi:hypothetical protein
MMKAEITRDVISDLWPLHKAGEASADSERVIEAFLAEDPAFRTLLQESEAIRRGMPNVALSSDAELRLIALSRERIRTTVWLVGAAIGAFVFVSMAFLLGALFFALSRS